MLLLGGLTKSKICREKEAYFTPQGAELRIIGRDIVF